VDLKWLGLGLLAYWLYNHYGTTDLGGSLISTVTGAHPPTPPPAPQPTGPTPPVGTPGVPVMTPPAPTATDWSVAIAACAAATPAGSWDGQNHVCHPAFVDTSVSHDPATTAFVLAAALAQDAAAAGMDPNGKLNVDQWNWLLQHDTRYTGEVASDLSRVGVKRDAAGATPQYTALQFAQLHVQDKGLAGLGRTLELRPVGQRWTM
jgi:hypothetical protein